MTEPRDTERDTEMESEDAEIADDVSVENTVGTDTEEELQQEIDLGAEWTPQQWQELLDLLVGSGLVTWKEVAAAVLGQLNPPQVATQLATSNKNLKQQYPKGKVWQAVKAWLYLQSGRCMNCGTLLQLQADHIIPKEENGPDTLDNFQLLCRRCNVIKRKSHKKGGLTPLTAASALMWLLFVYQPNTYDEYKRLCRTYGLTMSDQRFQEAWARAEWLKREGKYPFQATNP